MKRAPLGSQQQQESNEVAVDSTARPSVRPVETFYCTTNVQYLLLTFSDASTLSIDDLLSLSLAISLACLKTISGTAAVIAPLTTF